MLKFPGGRSAPGLSDLFVFASPQSPRGRHRLAKRQYRWNQELCPLTKGVFIGVGGRVPAGVICETYLVR
jgi:hypothetical protein